MTAETRFAATVRGLRQARGWSQSRLALEMASYGHILHQTTVAKLETASRPIRLSEAVSLALIFQISIEDAIRGDDAVARVNAQISIAEAELAAAEATLAQKRRNLTELYAQVIWDLSDEVRSS